MIDKEEIESAIQKILREADDFKNEPTYLKALELDKDISILRYMIGEDHFLSLHYFRMMHEQAILFIDNHDKNEKQNGSTQS